MVRALLLPDYYLVTVMLSGIKVRLGRCPLSLAGTLSSPLCTEFLLAFAPSFTAHPPRHLLATVQAYRYLSRLPSREGWRQGYGCLVACRVILRAPSSNRLVAARGCVRAGAGCHHGDGKRFGLGGYQLRAVGPPARIPWSLGEWWSLALLVWAAIEVAVGAWSRELGHPAWRTALGLGAPGADGAEQPSSPRRLLTPFTRFLGASPCPDRPLPSAAVPHVQAGGGRPRSPRAVCGRSEVLHGVAAATEGRADRPGELPQPEHPGHHPAPGKWGWWWGGERVPVGCRTVGHHVLKMLKVVARSGCLLR